MFKRFIIGILSIVMAATVLCGCSFFEHNYERDYQQVVATIKAYDIENEVIEDVIDETTGEPKIDPNTGDVMTHPVKYKYSAPKRTLYKRDLIDYINSNQSSLAQSYTDKKTLVKKAMEMLIDTELVINEVEALIDAGLVEWGQTQKNNVKKQIYSVIDGTLVSLKNTLLEERDEPKIDTDLEELSAEPTYPVKPDEEVDEGDVPEEPAWEPSLTSYPGLYGDSSERSLEREAMRRFVSLLKDRVKGDFRLTDEDKRKFKEDDKRIDEVIKTEGISYVYGMIGDTHYMYYLSGKNIERSFKITALNDYLTESVTVDESEVAERYTALLNGQRSAYDDDESQFTAAMSGSDTVLYYPNSDYFYVKHILLPFSDKQKAAFDKFKETATKEQVKAYRDRMVSGIVCYPHVAGEDDKTHPMTVAEVMNEVRAKMARYETNVKLADRTFDDLIYQYNTDPGAFGNSKGYSVNKDKSKNSYMEEFTDAALYMRDNLAVGQVYDEYVITDYGVHIMYLASTTKIGAVGLYDYTTPGETETYYDVLAETIRTAREKVAYQTWETNILEYNYKKQAVLHEDRYSDLWED